MRSVSKGVNRVSRGSLRFPLSRILQSPSCPTQNLSEKCIMNLTISFAICQTAMPSSQPSKRSSARGTNRPHGHHAWHCSVDITHTAPCSPDRAKRKERVDETPLGVVATFTLSCAAIRFFCCTIFRLSGSAGAMIPLSCPKYVAIFRTIQCPDRYDPSVDLCPASE